MIDHLQYTCTGTVPGSTEYDWIELNWIELISVLLVLFEYSSNKFLTPTSPPGDFEWYWFNSPLDFPR